MLTAVPDDEVYAIADLSASCRERVHWLDGPTPAAYRRCGHRIRGCDVVPVCVGEYVRRPVIGLGGIGLVEGGEDPSDVSYRAIYPFGDLCGAQGGIVCVPVRDGRRGLR